MEDMKKVLLINMPLTTCRRPSIGISLLKARLNEENINCDVTYLNIVFAAMIGMESYEELCANQFWKGFLGEWLFAQEYFGDKLPPEDEYIRFIEKFLSSLNIKKEKLLNMRGVIPIFLTHCLESIDWEQYDIIAFSSMFEQNMASVTLAHRIKLLHPAKTIIFGGANCMGEMGLELHRCFSFIDYVCSGDADFSFPEVVKRIKDKKTFEDIPGIIYRNKGKSTITSDVAVVNNLDSLPYPDYSDYFHQIKSVSSSASICGELPMETSRGCWWGERFQCNFCGVNGCSISFRSKSRDRVIKELDYLSENYARKYNIAQLYMVDNILDMKYFKEVIPEIKKRRFPVNIFYEVKANLNKEQIQMLAEAGVTWIQPGIESLNTRILKLMRKGLSALQNIQLLKFCKQFDIFPDWGIMTGFPGEKTADYVQLIELIHKITHLPPPEMHFPFVLQRYSPYYDNPEQHGIINIRPEEAYRFIYPFEESSLFNFAYYFDFDYRDDVKPPDCDRELTEAVNYWQECYADNEYLHSIKTSPSTLLIEDGRSNARISRIVLESSQKDIYEYCDRIRGFSSVFSHIREKYGNLAVRERDVRDFLDEMVSLNLMVSEDDRYLSIAVHVENGRARGRKVF